MLIIGLAQLASIGLYTQKCIWCCLMLTKHFLTLSKIITNTSLGSLSSQSDNETGNNTNMNVMPCVNIPFLW